MFTDEEIYQRLEPDFVCADTSGRMIYRGQGRNNYYYIDHNDNKVKLSRNEIQELRNLGEI